MSEKHFEMAAPPAEPADDVLKSRQERIKEAGAIQQRIDEIIDGRELSELDEKELLPVLNYYKQIRDLGRETVAGASELLKSEKQKLEQFFRQRIEVPALPKEAIKEKLEQWEKQGFELHYLPGIGLDKDKDYPGWKAKPEDLFYQLIKNGDIAADSAELKAGWVLIDGRQKPAHDGGKQMYENDALGATLKELRKKGLIADFKHQDSRFNISAEELEKPEVRQALAKALGVSADKLTVPRGIDFNAIGNLHHPEWGKTNTYEWFSDVHKRGPRLYGGNSGYGGLSHVSRSGADTRSDSLGFRFLVRFS